MEKDKDNVIFVGTKKSPTDYALAIMTSTKMGNKEVVVKARGRAMTNAINAVLILKDRFNQDVSFSNINLLTEERPYTDEKTKEDGIARVSSIEITVKQGVKKDEKPS